MTTRAIPDQAVEAAAKTYYGRHISEWEEATQEYREAELAAFRAILEAAAPHMLESAWDEGYMADGSARTDNPYRGDS